MDLVQLLKMYPDLTCFLDECNRTCLHVLVVLGCVYALSGLDDFFVDLIAWLGNCRPQPLGTDEAEGMCHKREKAIAIIVPAWEEWQVIARMLTGNASRIHYRSYHFFVGVYPNDANTQTEVRAVSHELTNVHAVVNDRPGPTSKGQILNHVIDGIFEYERKHGTKFDAFLMYDAEDVIHPFSLKLANHLLDRFDFVQTPVFSLHRSVRHLVAGTYMDEFAEAHTKDLLVRAKLGAAVPSAGVGTALSRALVDRLRRDNEGHVFNESSLTEDYEVGIRAHRMAAAAHFACVWYRDTNTGRREFIATREYFPKTFRRSVRQKTRWITGIAFQGARNLQWPGGWANRYFLARDRKAPLTNLATLLGYLILVYLVLYAWLLDPIPLQKTTGLTAVSVLIAANVFFMCNRLLQRYICVARVYGGLAALLIVMRWPVAIVINAFASVQAIRKHAVSLVGGTRIAWEKTSHEIPDTFEPVSAVIEPVAASVEPVSAPVGGQP
jgi:adsorption protein B